MAQRYVVVGPHPVLGKKRGEHVYLEDDQARRRMRSGHVEPAPPSKPASPPKKTTSQKTSASPPKRATSKTTTEPRETPGLSHAADHGSEASPQESSADHRPQEQDVKEADDG